MKKNRNKFNFLLILSLLISSSILLAQEPAGKIKVVTEKANIRLKPNIGSIIIQQVPEGTILDFIERVGEWYKVILNTDTQETIQGYVHESLIIEKESTQPKKIKKIEEKQEEKTLEKQKETELTPLPSIPQQSLQASLPQWGVLLSLGGNFFSGGDLNKGARGLADFYGESLLIKGKGEIKPVHMSYIYGGEVIFIIDEKFSAGLGVDYFHGKKESMVEFQKASSCFVFTTQPEIKAIPVRLVLYYFPLSCFYTKLGIEYYFAECTYYYRFSHEKLWQEWKGNSNAQGGGILGGLGFVYDISHYFSFFTEFTGRYAKIKGFEGKNFYKESSGITSSEEGKLYSYEGQISEEKSYPLLFIRSKKPSGANVLNPKQAIINFSGLAIHAGIKVRF